MLKAPKGAFWYDEAMESNVIIERAKPEDAKAVYDIQSQTWLDTYPNKELGITVEDVRAARGMDDQAVKAKKIARWRETIQGQGDSRAVFVAKVDGTVVGFNAPFISEDGRGRPAALYLLPDFQGKSIGAMLFQNSLGFLGERDLYLHVASYNHRTINFYKKFGFTEVGPVDAGDEVAALPSGAIIPEIEMVRPKAQE